MLVCLWVGLLSFAVKELNRINLGFSPVIITISSWTLWVVGVLLTRTLGGFGKW